MVLGLGQDLLLPRRLFTMIPFLVACIFLSMPRRTHGHLVDGLQTRVHCLLQIQLMTVNLGSILCNIVQGLDAHRDTSFSPHTTDAPSNSLHHDIVHLYGILGVDRLANEGLVEDHLA